MTDRSEYMKAYYAANREKRQAYWREYHAANAEKRRKQMLNRYYEKGGQKGRLEREASE